jgi:hypothetical protein
MPEMKVNLPFHGQALHAPSGGEFRHSVTAVLDACHACNVQL